MKEENKNKEDIFQEARQEALKKQLEGNKFLDKPKDEKIAIVKEKLEKGETQWDLLQRMIEGSLTEKFIKVISAMPDRDFARNYLKLLEYAKPKMTRIEGGDGPEKDTTINIQMVMLNDKGEKETITINNIEDGENVQK